MKPSKKNGGKIEQIRNASDIVDVIGSYLKLKRAGTNFVGLCPFHKEKTPSFNVSPTKQIFHCFGCHKGGDVFTFLREFENLSFVESVQRLAERLRIPIEPEDLKKVQREEDQRTEQRQTLNEQRQTLNRLNELQIAWEDAEDDAERERIDREFIRLFNRLQDEQRKCQQGDKEDSLSEKYKSSLLHEQLSKPPPPFFQR